MSSQSYGSGSAINDPPLVDGYVVWVQGGAGGSVSIPVATTVGSATSFAVQNMSSRYVRVTMNVVTPGNMVGNRSVLVAPGGTYDASFDVSTLNDVTLDLPQLPVVGGGPGATAVDTLGATAAGSAMVLFSFG